MSFFLGAGVCLSLFDPLYAAVTTVSGGLKTGYEYSNRDYSQSRRSSSNDNYSRFVISPLITITSETERQSLAVEYVPSYWYDIDQHDDKVDHSLSLDYLRLLTRYWQFSLTDNLRVTDQFNSYGTTVDQKSGDIVSEGPGTDISGDTLRDQGGRRRYTLNSLDLGTAYTYAQESSVAFDAIWTALRNNDVQSGDNYQDYDKYDLGTTVTHRYNVRWRSIIDAGVVLGRYDSADNSSGYSDSGNSDDVNEYRTSLLGEYRLTPLHTLSGYYGYNNSDYRGAGTDDWQIHTMHLGWAWRVTPHLDVNIDAGPTYSKRDGQGGDWNANGAFGLRYLMEKSRFGIKASHGTRMDNFSGTDQRGASKFWYLQTDFQHAFTEHISASTYANYSKEERDESSVFTPSVSDTTTEHVYAAGGALNYRFLEKYTASLSYGYVHNTSSDEDGDYDDNNIMMTISYANDLFQW
ncbi:MAG: hypothetical protein ACK5PS_14540 [Desulfopila sp.]